MAFSSFRRRRARSGCFSLLAVISLLGCAVLLFWTPLLTAAAQSLIEDDGPQKSDAVLVLGGDEFGTRILKAAQLVQAGYAPYALISGPPGLLGPESDETIEYARRHGYNSSMFRAMPSNSDSTRTETAFLGKYLRDHAIRKVILVTSNYHTRRAAKLLRRQVPDIWVIAVPAPDPFFTPDTWWKTRNGQKTFLYEWMKTAATAAGI